MCVGEGSGISGGMGARAGSVSFSFSFFSAILRGRDVEGGLIDDPQVAGASYREAGWADREDPGDPGGCDGGGGEGGCGAGELNVCISFSVERGVVQN